MKIGICMGIHDVDKAVAAGYDYIECTVTSVAEMDDSAYAAALEKINASPVKVEAFNVLFPGSLRLTGDEAVPERVDDYAARVFPRLKALGGTPVVFGSGGARRVPEGFDMDRAFEQLIGVGRILGRRAEENGLVIAHEPLNRRETNIINSEAEGRRLVNAVNHPGFALLTDWYHNYLESETGEDIRKSGPYVHTHVSSAPARTWLDRTEESQYLAFFRALRDTGYTGRMSYEGKSNDFEINAPETCAYMRELAARFGL